MIEHIVFFNKIFLCIYLIIVDIYYFDFFYVGLYELFCFFFYQL